MPYGKDKDKLAFMGRLAAFSYSGGSCWGSEEHRVGVEEGRVLKHRKSGF